MEEAGAEVLPEVDDDDTDTDEKMMTMIMMMMMMMMITMMVRPALGKVRCQLGWGWRHLRYQLPHLLKKELLIELEVWSI